LAFYVRIHFTQWNVQTAPILWRNDIDKFLEKGGE
jgi:hypothetical protein